MFSGNKIDFHNVYRSIGIPEAQRYGVGFMDKTGISIDTQSSSHPAYVMVLVLHGSGIYCDAGGNHYHLHPGSCFQRFPGISHTVLLDPESAWKECFIELGKSLWEFLRSTLGVNQSRPVLEATLSPGLIDRFSSLQQHFRTDSDMELIHRLPDILELVQILHAGGHPARYFSQKALLSEACAFLSADFTRPADLRDFCRRHGCGYENFRKLFKEELGISPHRYRIRRRLDEACALLTGSDLTIAEISVRLGYSSPYEFSSQFKTRMGCPPGSYKSR